MDVERFIDLDSAKERFMGNEDLYKQFLFELPNRTLYQELEAHMAAGNVEEAFETAHKMKGVIENLAINLLSRKIREIVEMLRIGELPDETARKELGEVYRETIDVILNIQKSGARIF